MGFDPVQLLMTKLQARFAHVASFFADEVGGRAVAFRWELMQQHGAISVSAFVREFVQSEHRRKEPVMHASLLDDTSWLIYEQRLSPANHKSCLAELTLPPKLEHCIPLCMPPANELAA